MSFLSAKKIRKKGLFWLDKLLSLILGISALGFLWLCWQVFFWASFNIPSASMEPEILPGDRIVVWKPILGARLFDIFSLLGRKEVEIYRIPGLSSVKRNDVVVFNYPYFNGWNRIEMHIKEYYVKRCIGLPGDTISIQNGWYHIAGIQEPLGNKAGQQQTADTEEELLKQEKRWTAFPNHPSIDWNIKNFGPLMIPGKDSEIVMSYKNYILYHVLIEWETKKKLTFDELTNCCNIDQQPLQKNKFKQNYLFMSGDNMTGSEDSRYWGLVPESFVVGKAGFVFKSYDPISSNFRWDRFLKRII